MLERGKMDRDLVEFVVIDQLVPKEHLLRKIDAAVDFTQLYEMVEPLYCEDNGRPSIDPVVLFKMVLIQHLYGLPSLRRTAEEVSANNCYRWFLGYPLQEETPHFSTVSYNFRHRFTEETVDRVFVWILDEVAKGHSEIGIIYLNRQNSKGIQQNMDKLGLEAIDLIPFKTHIYLRKGHPLAKKESLVMEDLVALPTVRFTQEKDEYLYYSENFVDTSDSSLMFNVTDRATLNGILERTDAYATGSGFLDAQSVNGITVIPLEDNLDNKMVYVRRKGINLSSCALKFVNVMFDYFDTYKP